MSVVLFSAYINSLANLIQDVPGFDFVGIYADNIFAISSGPPDNVYSNLLRMNEVLQAWASHRGAVIPTNKSELLHICRRRNCLNPNINFGNVEKSCIN